MSQSEEEKKGAQAPAEGSSSAAEESAVTTETTGEGAPSSSSGPDDQTAAGTPSSYTYPDDSYGYYGDSDYIQQPEVPVKEEQAKAEVVEQPKVETLPATAAGSSGPPLVPPKKTDEEDDEEDGMLRMSFLEHLEELRSRLIKALAGVGIAFAFSIIFANQLWLLVSAPAVDALKAIGADPNLAQITPMDAFTTIWVKLPMLAAIFLSSPWILYQVWGFIAPGLYRRERRWAGPFVICTAGLFIAGGLFAYFVAFRFGLTFLLGIGRNINVKPVVSLTEYFDLFVNVTLGIGLVFELPVLIFFLILLRIVTPRFLISNSRYAILIIVLLAAVVTPTPDVFNLMIFSLPMCGLYFVGVFAGYLLNLRRENRRFPWGKVAAVAGIILAVAAGVVWLAVTRYGFGIVYSWPFLVRK